MNDYSIWEVSNGWFKSYLSNCSQFVFINGYDFVFAAINCDVPQHFIQGPLLFFLFINDPNQAIKFCKIHHFADGKNLLCLNPIRKLNKLVNADLTKIPLLNVKKKLQRWPLNLSEINLKDIKIMWQKIISHK